MNFTLPDLYTILIELAFSSLFLIIFSSIHYSLNNIKKVRETFQKNKVAKFFYFFIFGTFLSSLTFGLSQLCVKTLGTDIGLPIIILGLVLVMSFFYSAAIQVGSLISSILWVVLTYMNLDHALVNILVRVGIILIYAFVALVLHIAKNKKTLFFVLASLFVTGGVTLFIATMNDPKFIFHTSELVISMAIMIVFLGIMKWVNNIFTNISNIAYKSVYADKHFLVPESFELNFNNYVKQYKINQALVILFEISDCKNKDVKQQFLTNLFNALNKEEYRPLFFKNEYNKHGVILSGKQFYVNNLEQAFKGNVYPKRLEIDNLLVLQNILNSVPLKYQQDSKKYEFTFKAYASIYGVHSYDINELLNNDMFMINNEDLHNSNIVKVFHTNMTQFIGSDRINYATLTQNVNLDEITVNLELVQFPHKHELFVLPRVYWLSKMIGNHKSIIEMFSPKIGNTLLRNWAMKSLELYVKSEYVNKHKLIIYYPIDELNTLFYSLNIVVQKMKLIGVNPNDVIFCFDTANMAVWPKVVLKHLKEYDEMNIQYIFLNLNNPSVLISHKPLLTTFGQEVLKDKAKLSKANIICKQQKINVLLSNNKQI